MHKIISFILFLTLYSSADTPKLFLLKTYKNHNINGWVMSEKLDGIRAYWNGKELLTRGGKKIYAPKWFTKDYPPFEVDGELWSKRGDFENISSIVRDKTPSLEWKSIKHYIFEVPNRKGNLFERLDLVKPYENNHLKILKQVIIKHKKYLDEFHDSILKLGGEGVVVREPNSNYINKRTSTALKVKKFKDTECTIVGYTKGKGKYLGKVGAIKCQMNSGIEFKIGRGLSDDFRSNPPKIGAIVTFKYQNLTKYKKPRFPVFMRVRYP